MSHNDTWMPLYIGDYLGDTMELDGAQHGAYLLLLMYYWRNGPLPIDDAKLAQIARTDIRLWKKLVGPVVRAFFHEQDGRLHQKRCDLELAKVEGISAKRREAAWNRHHPNGQDPNPGLHANAPANAQDLHLQTDMQTPSKPDANGDANGMLRAIARPSPSQSQKEPPLGPPQNRGGRRRAAKPLFKNGFLQVIADEGMPSLGQPPDNVTPIDRFVALANVPRRVAR
jgi:uncharacterized protein YdaU (DUF1376 family)